MNKHPLQSSASIACRYVWWHTYQAGSSQYDSYPVATISDARATIKEWFANGKNASTVGPPSSAQAKPPSGGVAGGELRAPAHLNLVRMPLRFSVYESGGAQDYIYFLITSIVSMLYVMDDGSSAEIVLTCDEGTVGISVFMSGESTPSRAMAQCAGKG